MLKVSYLFALAWCHDELVSDLLIGDVLAELISKNILTELERQKINGLNEDSAKVEYFLGVLKNKYNESFEDFLDILENTNPDICSKMRRKIREMPSVPSACEFLKSSGALCTYKEYISRENIENQFKKLLTNEFNKPIFVHGALGSGKSTLVYATIEKSDSLYKKYKKCVWVEVGNVHKDNIREKLALILRRINPQVEVNKNEVPEIIKTQIESNLRDQTTLLIIDHLSLMNIDLKKYFIYPYKYIIISRNSYFNESDKHVHIPDTFTNIECEKLLNSLFPDLKREILNKIIEKSLRNPKLLMSVYENSIHMPVEDFIIEFEHFEPFKCFMKELEYEISLLPENVRSNLEKLVVLEYDDHLSKQLLGICMNVENKEAVSTVFALCKAHILTSKQGRKFKFYKISDINLYYLKSNGRTKEEEYCSSFISNYSKYTDWCKNYHFDPFIFIHYERTLNITGKIDVIRKWYNDFPYNTAKIVICGISKVLNDLERFNLENENEKNEMAYFERFLMVHGHELLTSFTDSDDNNIMTETLNGLLQLGLYERKDLPIYKKALKTIKNIGIKENGDFYDCLNPIKDCKIWKICTKKQIRLIDINKLHILILTEDGFLSFYQTDNGKYLFTYQTLDIRFVKFVKDNLICFVNLEGKFEFKTLDILKKESKEQKIQFSFNVNQGLHYGCVHGVSEDFKYDDNEIASAFEWSCRLSEIGSLNQLNSIADKNNVKINQDTRISSPLLLKDKIIGFKHKGEITKFEIYDFSGGLKDDFEVPSAKKCVPRSVSGFYILKDNSREIIESDEFGFSNPKLIENDDITDIESVNDELFYSVTNKFYEHRKGELFTVNSSAIITKFSIASSSSLVAVLVDNTCIEIWNYLEGKLLYVLKDTAITDVMLHNENNLIIVTPSRVINWDIPALVKSHSRKNLCYPSLNYHSHFWMFNLSSSLLLVLQSYKHRVSKKEIVLEFWILENEEFQCILRSEEAKTASSVSCSNNFLVIGFGDSFKIYNLSKDEVILEKDVEIEGSIENVFHFEDARRKLNIILHLSPNKIKVYDLVVKNLDLKKVFDISSEPCLRKFFPLDPSIIYCIENENNKLILYKINTEIMSKTKEWHLREDIVDVDMNDTYLCAISKGGSIKLWDINSDKNWEHHKFLSDGTYLKNCKLRPDSIPSEWITVAVTTDEGSIFVIYFSKHQDVVNEEEVGNNLLTKEMRYHMPMLWSCDGSYLFVGCHDILKWNIPLQWTDSMTMKPQKLKTHFGGVMSLEICGGCICCIDPQGAVCLLKKIL